MSQSQLKSSKSSKQNSKQNSQKNSPSSSQHQTRRNSNDMTKILLENERTNEEVKLERLRNKARLEIGEVEELIPQKIQEMKDVIATGDCKYHMHPDKYDGFYLTCLRAKKYETDRAAKLYKKFCGLMTKTNSWACTTPSTFYSLYANKMGSVLKTRDNKGRHVFLVRCEKWDPKTTGFEQVLSSFILLLDEMLKTEDTQLNGIVLIADLKTLSLSHARLIRPAQLSAIVDVIQDAYPARFKELHVFNNPFVFNMFWNIVKPIVKEKMRKRIYFHGGDVGSLHRGLSIDLKNLPEFISGKVPEDEYADMEIIERLTNRDDYYKDFCKYGIPANLNDECGEDY